MLPAFKLRGDKTHLPDGKYGAPFVTPRNSDGAIAQSVFCQAIKPPQAVARLQPAVFGEVWWGSVQADVFFPNCAV